MATMKAMNTETPPNVGVDVLCDAIIGFGGAFSEKRTHNHLTIGVRTIVIIKAIIKGPI